jgi:type II secretory pathway pseudopilin PulG
MLILGAIVLIAILGVVMLTAVSQLLQSLRQQRREDEVRQTQYLAEAAVARGILRLTSDANYTGEEWRVQIPVAEGNNAAGVVQIRIEKPVDATTGEVVVAARFPADTDGGVRYDIRRPFAHTKQGQP